MDLHLVALDPDHPGFRDLTYRQRRDAIARIALGHRAGQPVPEAPYTEQEHGVWREVLGALAPVHARGVHRELLEVDARLGLDRLQIPQLEAVNARLGPAGFRMEPVAGLVTPQSFLEHLGRGIFLSTQYIRHHSRPFYTPEPDVVHELVGHAASLLHPGIARVSRRFGKVAATAGDELVAALTRIYWYTLEFGLVHDAGEVKAWGAGLLSSVGELEHALSPAVERVPWDLARVAVMDYDPTAFQPAYVVAPELGAALADLEAWLEARGA
ncbi:MAG: phenylalanine 4-monooxygenase [Myxococcota bacterium]|nr:phenylalanine 4-monooxygenase [Myxococcota bacterium]